MQAITTYSVLKTTIEQVKSSGKTIGFVPTMGALHKGHASLIEYAIENCNLTVVSIFVNPTQFNNPSDLKKYPRTVERDVEFLSSFKENVIVYVPNAEEVYGNIISSKNYNFGTLENVMEGKHRPGHFDGVGTVLNKLFRQVTPDKAFFGEKDFQQLAIVKKLVQKERLDITIIGCPIYRQEDGLAMSSRNTRLTKHQLEIAPFIYKTLLTIKSQFKSQSVTYLKQYAIQEFIKKEGLELEYFEIVNEKNLKPLSRKRTHQKYRAFLAVYAGEIRLIDNIALN